MLSLKCREGGTLFSSKEYPIWLPLESYLVARRILSDFAPDGVVIIRN